MRSGKEPERSGLGSRAIQALFRRQADYWLRVLVPGSRLACPVGGVLAEPPRLPETGRGRYADGGTSTARTSATNAGTCPTSRASSSRTDIGGRR